MCLVRRSRRHRWADCVQRAWPCSFLQIRTLSMVGSEVACVGSHRGPERPRAYRFEWISMYGYISSLKIWMTLHSEMHAWEADLLRTANYRWEGGLVDLNKESHMPLTVCALQLGDPSELPSSAVYHSSFLKQADSSLDRARNIQLANIYFLHSRSVLGPGCIGGGLYSKTLHLIRQMCELLTIVKWNDSCVNFV